VENAEGAALIVTHSRLTNNQAISAGSNSFYTGSGGALDNEVGSTATMVCYSMAQELATWLHYRNLRLVIGMDGCPAPYKLLGYISVDERAHFEFFHKLVQLHLEEDRPGTIEQLRRVLNHFQMPAIYALADGQRRIAAVKALRIMDDALFYQHVYLPILEYLGIQRCEIRNRAATRKSLSAQR
jgi:hypothetical protein